MKKEKSDAGKKSELLGDISFLSDFLEKDRNEFEFEFEFKNSVHFVELASYRKKSKSIKGNLSNHKLIAVLENCVRAELLKTEYAPQELENDIRTIHDNAKLNVSNNYLYTLTQKGEEFVYPNELSVSLTKMLYLFIRSTRPRRFHAFQGEDFLRGAFLVDELSKLGKLVDNSYETAKNKLINQNLLRQIIIENKDLTRNEKDFLDSYRNKRSQSPPLFKSTRIGENYLISKLDEIIEKLIGKFENSPLKEYTILNLYCSDITEKLLGEKIEENSKEMNYEKMFSKVLKIAQQPDYSVRKSEIFVNYPSLFFDDSLKYALNPADNNKFKIYISFDFYSFLKVNKLFEKDKCPFEIFEKELMTFFDKLKPDPSKPYLRFLSESFEGFYLWNYGLLSQGPTCYEECKVCKNKDYKDKFESNADLISWIKARKNLVNDNLDIIKKSGRVPELLNRHSER